MSRYSGLPIYRAGFGDFFAVPAMPDADTIFESVNTQNHVWKSTDRMDKLAYIYYSNEDLWWVIAWFNKVPDEAQLLPGMVLLIPDNPEFIVSLFDSVNKAIGV